MSSSTAQSRQFIEDYLNALSGQPKTDELVARLVSDPSLVEHIRQVEAAFPAYELIVQRSSRRETWWRCEAHSAGSTKVRSRGSSPLIKLCRPT